MKNFSLILGFILFFGLNSGIAQEEREYETDGTLTVESPVDGRSLNGIFPYREVVGQTTRACFWIVGDSGLVLRLRSSDGCGYPNMKRLSTATERVLNPAHNLMSISFADRKYGWVVGYVNGGADHWKGVVWNTTDSGRTWSVQYPLIAHGEKIPCLKVQAVNRRVVWISCGHGYVLRTMNGGVTWRVSRPGFGAARRSGWWYGLCVFDRNTAWVAGDQTYCVYKTTNGGQSRTPHEPGRHINPPDTTIVYSIPQNNP